MEMRNMYTIPHRPVEGLCPVNGIRDLIEWRSGRNWSNEFLYGLGLGGGFTCLRFNSADPPRQVYWGIAGPRQHKYLAELLTAEYAEIENRSFTFSWRKAQEALIAGTPPILGPLDMFYMPFYDGIYQKRHIPIHYLLLVGYDESQAYVYDTGNTNTQEILLEELRKAWDVNVPGLGKKNRLIVYAIPVNLPSTETLIRKSISDQCQVMLYPPVSMVGIPAMKKIADEIANWPKELGEETANKCLKQVLEYLNSPPDIEGNHLTAGRDLYVTFLEEASEMTGFNLTEPINSLRESIASIPVLADVIHRCQLDDAATTFHRIAEFEAEAYLKLREIIAT
jgi:hypothetical protein